MEVGKINSDLNFGGVVNVAGNKKQVGNLLKHVVSEASKQNIAFRFMSLEASSVDKNFRAYMITTGKEAQILKQAQSQKNNFYEITKKIGFPKGTKSPQKLLKRLESGEIVLSTFKSPPFFTKIKRAVERRFLEFVYGVDD